MSSQIFADLLATAAHSDSNAALVATILPMLSSPDATSRLRGSMLAGAAGPSAAATTPDVRELLTDSSSAVRKEAAYALGAMGASDSITTDALLRALTNPTDGQLAWQARSSFRTHLHSGMTPGSVTMRFAREHLTDTSRALCGSQPCGPLRGQDAILVLDKIDVPWKRAAFRDILGSSAPPIRIAAAWSLANMGSAAIDDTSALRPLLADTVEWVRNGIPGVLQQLKSGGQSNLPLSCPHRQIDETAGGDRALIPASLRIVGGPTLSADGRDYENIDEISSNHSYAYNFMLPFALSGARTAYRMKAPEVRKPARFVVVDLTHPVDANSPKLGPVRDSTFELHSFWMRDRRGYIWNSRDVPVGASAWSDLTEFYFTVGDRAHVMKFGPWRLGDCNQHFGTGTGDGTTMARIDRLSEFQWRFAVPPGNRGRVWDYTQRTAPTDLGLYSVSFELLVTAQK